MRFTLLRLLLASSLVPLATALQSIYLTTIAFSRSNHFLAFFSDSDPCTDGTIFGFPQIGFHNCDEPLTILGHDNITFTGCPPSSDPYSGFPGSLPTAVADAGEPALRCETASNPPDGPYGAFADCPYVPGNDEVHVGGVSLLEYYS